MVFVGILVDNLTRLVLFGRMTMFEELAATPSEMEICGGMRSLSETYGRELPDGPPVSLDRLQAELEGVMDYARAAQCLHGIEESLDELWPLDLD